MLKKTFSQWHIIQSALSVTLVILLHPVSFFLRKISDFLLHADLLFQIIPNPAQLCRHRLK